MAVLGLLAAVALAAHGADAPATDSDNRGPVPAPAHGAYTGAYLDFGETEDHVTAGAMRAFESLVGKHQAIVLSSSYWGRGFFPAENVRLIADYGAIPLISWSPWAPPYDQGPHSKAGPWSLQRIVAGDCDAYIDQWAAGARDYGRPLMVSFGNEPNSDWYPWSGVRNGADGKPADGGSGFAGPEMYKKAYRHAVDRVRAAGARNVAWVFQANNDSLPNRKWNALSEYYPGADYVDWIGMSVYGQLTPGHEGWVSWKEAMDDAYAQLARLDPRKPLMLVEWGVGEFPDSGSKAEFIHDAFRSLNGNVYPRIKAAVFWHERWQNENGSYSNLRVQSSPGALKAYREGVANPFWLDKAE